MTQGDPLSPTIFNVVVDAVLHHLVTVLEASEEAVNPGAANTEYLSRDVHHLAAYLYA